MATRKIAPSPRPTTIGFAYGTFDLLHDGHRHLLRQAHARCDELIVAIDSDRYARERKGWGRPVEDEATRSYSVVATNLVDLVIAIDSYDQLFQAIRYYQPDIIFAGADGHRQAIDDEKPRVVLIPLLPGHSTTAAIKERLQ